MMGAQGNNQFEIGNIGARASFTDTARMPQLINHSYAARMMLHETSSCDARSRQECAGEAFSVRDRCILQRNSTGEHEMKFPELLLRWVVRAVTMLALAATPRVSAAEQVPGPAIAPAFHQTIPNIPGKSLSAIVVYYPPGGKSLPHRHARSAFVTGYVLSGAIRSQVDGGKVQVFNAGESWFEKPGTRHDISENASSTEPAKLLAIFVVDSEDTNLTIGEGQ
jgi:quercetin dioxygenase-like cupin family protein